MDEYTRSDQIKLRHMDLLGRQPNAYYIHHTFLFDEDGDFTKVAGIQIWVNEKVPG